MNNLLQIELIREYLIENKKSFEKENIIEWINKYADKYRNILNWWTTNILLIKEQLYGEN